MKKLIERNTKSLFVGIPSRALKYSVLEFKDSKMSLLSWYFAVAYHHDFGDFSERILIDPTKVKKAITKTKGDLYVDAGGYADSKFGQIDVSADAVNLQIQRITGGKDGTPTIECDGAELARVLQSMAHATVGAEDHRMELYQFQIRVKSGSDKAQVIATDGTRLAIRDLALTSCVQTDIEILLSAQAVNFLKLLKGSGHCEISEHRIRSVLAEYTFRGGLGNFPPVDLVIDGARGNPEKCEITMDLDPVIEFLTAVKKEAHVRIDAGTAGVVMTTPSGMRFEARGHVSGVCDIAVNPLFLLQFFKNCKGGAVVLRISGAKKPVICSDYAGKEEIIMPITAIKKGGEK